MKKKLTKVPEPCILFEDNHLIAILKPFGMPSQGDASGDESLFEWTKEYIRSTYQKTGNVYLALLHRLDRPAGGVILLAKTSKAAGRVSKMFQKREIQKVYVALTEKPPAPDQGTLQHYLKQLPHKNIMRAYQKAVPDSKSAKLDYTLIKKKDQKALVMVQLHSGRKHQIRVQLSSIGCPIKGDMKYGASSFNPDKSICLFAQKLSLIHPVKKEPLIIEAPMPETAWWQL